MRTSRYLELQFEKSSLKVPQDYWYAGYDTWVKLEGDEALVGVTDFFQTKLGDILYVSVTEENSVEQDDVLATLESVKATIDVTVPATGEIIARNTELDAHPELIARDPFGAGWIVRLRLTDWEADKAMLLTAEGYFKLMQDKVAKELERE